MIINKYGWVNPKDSKSKVKEDNKIVCVKYILKNKNLHKTKTGKLEKLLKDKD